MKIIYKSNFAGYFTILRAIQYLIQSKTLSFTELGVYICLIAQSDYDIRHETYGVVVRDDNVIARALNCDPTTIFKHRKALIKKGLLIIRNDLTVIPNLYLYELSWTKILAKLPPAYLQELFVKPQDNLEDLQRMIAKMQREQPRKTSQSSIVSSKGELSSSAVSTQKETKIDEVEEEEIITSLVEGGYHED